MGFLFCSSKEDVINLSPILQPNYSDLNLSNYSHFDKIVEDNYKYFFAPELIELIKSYPGHEIATHTFSHYYCLEPGQNVEEFKCDIISAIQIANSFGIELKSIVFPRNQVNRDYLEVIKNFGITSYRGNERSLIYKAVNSDGENIVRRALRFLDAYINISGHHCYSLKEIGMEKPFDVPSSRFLRPYSPKLKFFETFRLKRILNAMTYAAMNGRVFHIWWHPHNFGINQKENFLLIY